MPLLLSFLNQENLFPTFMDVTELTDKYSSWSTDEPVARHLHSDNFRADHCIILFCWFSTEWLILSRGYMGGCAEAGGFILGTNLLSRNWLSGMFHPAVDFICFKYRALSKLKTSVPHFRDSAANFRLSVSRIWAPIHNQTCDNRKHIDRRKRTDCSVLLMCSRFGCEVWI